MFIFMSEGLPLYMNALKLFLVLLHCSIFLMLNTCQMLHTHPCFRYILSCHLGNPRVLEYDTEPLRWPSAKCVKYKITVLPSLMSLSYSGVWRRTMIQTIWSDDICPVRREREKKKGVRLDFWKQCRKILCYNWTERDGRRDLWAESKVNNYNIMTPFLGACLKEDHLSLLIGNFLCLLRIISHVVDFDEVVCWRKWQARWRGKKFQIETWLENFHNAVSWETFCSN